MTIRAAAISLVFMASQSVAGTMGNAGVNDVTLGGEAADAFKYADGINPHGKAGAKGFAGSFAATGSGSWANVAGFETAKGKSGTDVAILPTGDLLFAFTNTNGLNGDWSLTNKNLARDVRLDLVFAMHTGGGSGAWLFDNQVIQAGAKLSGNWVQKMFNDGQQMGAFSNLTLFTRNVGLMPKKSDPVVPGPVVPGPVVPGPVVPGPVVPGPVVPGPVVPGPVGPVGPAGPVVPIDPVGPVPVPEPGTLATLALGLGLLGALRRRKQS